MLDFLFVMLVGFIYLFIYLLYVIINTGQKCFIKNYEILDGLDFEFGMNNHGKMIEIVYSIWTKLRIVKYGEDFGLILS